MSIYNAIIIGSGGGTDRRDGSRAGGQEGAGARTARPTRVRARSMRHGGRESKSM